MCRFATLMSHAHSMSENFSLLCDYTNIELRGQDNLFVFHGKNEVGTIAAELLNEMQLNEKLFYVPVTARRKGHGFYRIAYPWIEYPVLKDLREATNGKQGQYVFCGPNLAPLVFAQEAMPSKSKEQREGYGQEDTGYYENNSGDIHSDSHIR